MQDSLGQAPHEHDSIRLSILIRTASIFARDSLLNISQLQNAVIELSRAIEALRAEVEALKATKFTGRCYYEEIK